MFFLVGSGAGGVRCPVSGVRVAPKSRSEVLHHRLLQGPDPGLGAALHPAALPALQRLRLHAPPSARKPGVEGAPGGGWGRGGGARAREMRLEGETWRVIPRRAKSGQRVGFALRGMFGFLSCLAGARGMSWNDHFKPSAVA